MSWPWRETLTLAKLLSMLTCFFFLDVNPKTPRVTPHRLLPLFLPSGELIFTNTVPPPPPTWVPRPTLSEPRPTVQLVPEAQGPEA